MDFKQALKNTYSVLMLFFFSVITFLFFFFIIAGFISHHYALTASAVLTLTVLFGKAWSRHRIQLLANQLSDPATLYYKIGLPLCLVVLGSLFALDNTMYQEHIAQQKAEQAEKERKQAERQERVSAKREKLRPEYQEVKEQLVQQVQNAIDNAEFGNAREVGKRFDVIDTPELTKAKNQITPAIHRHREEQKAERLVAEAKEAKANGDLAKAKEKYRALNEMMPDKYGQAYEQALYNLVKSLPAESYGRNKHFYGQLKRLNPDKELYQSKFAYYKKKHAEPQRQLEAAKERKKEFRESFGHDGRHRILAAFVKRRLHNPDSFEHVNTKVIEDGENYIVRMTYRAENGFGAIRTDTTAVKVNDRGRAIKYLEL